ncbi:ArsR/SmtB family transcription factor [Natronorarus salvus]|uniref:ArsR/SmtB family transcription factor n=1 Tax=Natronorarus salvus TaxID=3117733 RepID=UPI002F2648ED
MAETERAPSEPGFDLLSDETRIDIVRTLVDHLRESPDEPSIGFSDLRRRVGVRDSGNFSYHLNKLEGRFVRKTAEGYRIAPAGLKVVAALITGTYDTGSPLGPLELEDRCPVCDGRLTATYRDGLLGVRCPNDHVFKNTLPPGTIDDRTLPEVLELWTHKTRNDLALATEGICPFCYGRLELSAGSDIGPECSEVETRCPRCGVSLEIPVIVSACRHPTVTAYYFDHGIDVRATPLWASEFYDPVDVSRSTDPDRIHLSIDLGHDPLAVTLDDSLAVVRVSAPEDTTEDLAGG